MAGPEIPDRIETSNIGEGLYYMSCPSNLKSCVQWNPFVNSFKACWWSRTFCACVCVCACEHVHACVCMCRMWSTDPRETIAWQTIIQFPQSCSPCSGNFYFLKLFYSNVTSVVSHHILNQVISWHWQWGILSVPSSVQTFFNEYLLKISEKYFSSVPHKLENFSKELTDTFKKICWYKQLFFLFFCLGLDGRCFWFSFLTDQTIQSHLF